MLFYEFLHGVRGEVWREVCALRRRCSTADKRQGEAPGIFELDIGVVANRDALALGADHDLPGLGALWIDAQAKAFGSRIPQGKLFSECRLRCAGNDVGQEERGHSLRIVSEIGGIVAVWNGVIWRMRRRKYKKNKGLTVDMVLYGGSDKPSGGLN
jgi:hypothetical protein